MKTPKNTLATSALILMTCLFMMITMSSPAQEMLDTADRAERQMVDNPPGQELLPGDPDQRDMHHDKDGVRLSEKKMSGKLPEESPGVRFMVDSDALINGLTVGRGAGNRETNTAIGSWALFYNESGLDNTAIGRSALYSNKEGSSNTAVGRLALFSNTSGMDNTAIGRWALYHNRANSRSTAMGYQAMRYADNRESGRNTYNTAVGYEALRGSTTAGNNTGQFNTAIGDQALFSNTSGESNTAIGVSALRDNTTGSSNTAVGIYALRFNREGDENTAIGRTALGSNKANSRSTAIGYQAMMYADDRTTNARQTYNTAVGYQALMGSETASDNTGRFNTAIGDQALLSNTSGWGNTAIGYVALRDNTSGTDNTAIGRSALRDNTTGTFNTAIGAEAMYSNTSGWSLTAIGSGALSSNTTGSSNTAIGRWALYSNTSGYENTAIGRSALHSNTLGWSNTAIGYLALTSNTSGDNNTAIGRNALTSNTSGSNNTAVGRWAGGGYKTINEGTFIGTRARPFGNDLSNATGIGYEARPNASNRVRIGNASVTEIGGFTGWSNVSDAQYKSNVEENIPGLEFILRLRPVTYNMNVHKLAADLEEDLRPDEDGNMTLTEPSEAVQKARDEKSAIIYSGFIAQEVEKAAMGLGYEFSGVGAPKNDADFYSLRYAEFVVPIVKAIQEQQAQIETLSPEGMDELLGRVAALETDNANLVAEQKALHEANELMITQQKALRQANELLITEQEVLRAENERMRGQVGDILDLLAALGVEIQQCCTHRSEETGYAPEDLQPFDSGHAWLEQNAPNPFRENTLIRYYLPEGFQQAEVVIADVGGNRIRSFSLSGTGHGQILISGGTMKAGTYVYTLTVDGRQADSKRMVLL